MRNRSERERNGEKERWKGQGKRGGGLLTRRAGRIDRHVHRLADDRVEVVADAARERPKGKVRGAIARGRRDGDTAEAKLLELDVDAAFNLGRVEHAGLELGLEVRPTGLIAVPALGRLDGRVEG